jgi:hypothetical protein
MSSIVSIRGERKAIQYQPNQGGKEKKKKKETK